MIDLSIKKVGYLNILANNDLNGFIPTISDNTSTYAKFHKHYDKVGDVHDDIDFFNGGYEIHLRHDKLHYIGDAFIADIPKDYYAKFDPCSSFCHLLGIDPDKLNDNYRILDQAYHYLKNNQYQIFYIEIYSGADGIRLYDFFIKKIDNSYIFYYISIKNADHLKFDYDIEN